VWGLNIFSDLLLLLFFLLYCPNVHKQNTQRQRRFWVYPQASFSLFPGKLGFRLSVLMIISMYAFRLPGLYFSASKLNALPPDPLLSFYSALFIVNLSTVTIFCFAMFWSVAILLFHADFTACPDK
jgi:hypothetical protein